ncbi:MAG: hypothetical protein C5B49_14270 [Bdellovibrio sp.]|nr:MAG: hypothetical protein C5B49_14270 [Bdellovibrio sp.]
MRHNAYFCAFILVFNVYGTSVFAILEFPDDAKKSLATKMCNEVFVGTSPNYARAYLNSHPHSNLLILRPGAEISYPFKDRVRVEDLRIILSDESSFPAIAEVFPEGHSKAEGYRGSSERGP